MPSVAASESDEDLVEALGRGDSQAVAMLYQRYGSKMLAFARRYLADSIAAEDVVIDLLSRWLERPPSVRESERLSTFLATSVYHAAVDWVRRDRAEQGQPPRGDPSLAPSPRVGKPATPPPAESAEVLEARLATAIDRLSSSDRLLLETHYGRALTPEECMTILRISRAAFHQRLHRARTRLARLMADDPVLEAKEKQHG